MNVKEVIVPIETNQIYPHPDNPRKDLGDLTELVESIKKNGIMQNLTVIPGHWLTDNEIKMLVKIYQESPDEETRVLLNKKWIDEGYTLIIGHRRCAAAKLAGVKTLPCRIIEGMTKKEQVSTMLEENMQRNDLTIYEQAQGFQMMLDLGDTEQGIAEKTGFSRTTIRRRLSIAKLDPALLKEKNEDDSFQLSLKDLYELEKIEDVTIRNKILKECNNSRELVWRARSAVEEEKRSKAEKAIVEMLKEKGVEQAPKKAEKELYSGKWDTIKEFDLDKEVPETISIKKTKEKMYYMRYYARIKVIIPAKGKKKSEWELRREQEEKNKKAINAMAKEMAKTRIEFVRNVISGEIEPLKDTQELENRLWKAMLQIGIFVSMGNVSEFFLKKKQYDSTTEEREEAMEKAEKLSKIHQMLAVTVMKAKDVELVNYQGEYKEDYGKALKLLNSALGLYGFTLNSEEEESVINGTHEYYKVREE